MANKTRISSGVLEFTFSLGAFCSFLIFTLDPPAAQVSVGLIAMGLIAGLVFIERVPSRLLRLFMIVPITWMVIVLAMFVARTMVRHGWSF
jgi:hypothetical protein